MNFPDVSDRLDSWKAIASYLGRSVRTVKRWEVNEGLPVHRHLHQRQSTVYAFQAELDRWRASRSHAGESTPVSASDSSAADGVLILPFDHIGPDPSRQWLADGFSEALIADLATLDGLRVLSRTSSRTLRQRCKDARAIGRRHGVRYLVEGSCRSLDARLRLSVRLIDVERDARIWSESFDGIADDAFELQSQLAAAVTEALERTEGRDLSASGATPAAGEDVATWQCLVLGRQQSLTWRADGLEAAVKLLEKGLERLGERPSLLAALGRTWLQYRESAIDVGPEPIERARQCARRLAECAQDHPGALQLDGWLAYTEGQVPEAIDILIEADQAQPNDPETLGLLVNCLLISDRAEQARPLIRHLLSIDPLSPLTACLPGWDLLLEGEFERALPHYQAMHQMDRDHPMGRLFLIWASLLANRTDDLLRLAEPEDSRLVNHPALRVARFLAAAGQGQPDAPRWLDESVTRLARVNEMIARFLGDGYALLDETATAIRWVEVSVERGFSHQPFLASHNPLLKSLRDHSDFQRLLDRIASLGRKI